MMPKEFAGLTTASTAISVMSLLAMWITIGQVLEGADSGPP
jgi:hypothetical protein